MTVMRARAAAAVGASVMAVVMVIGCAIGIEEENQRLRAEIRRRVAIDRNVMPRPAYRPSTVAPHMDYHA